MCRPADLADCRLRGSSPNKNKLLGNGSKHDKEEEHEGQEKEEN